MTMPLLTSLVWLYCCMLSGLLHLSFTNDNNADILYSAPSRAVFVLYTPTITVTNATTTIQVLRYYGQMAGSSSGVYIWIVLQRVIIPIIIFFRFHSLVMLVECWKNTYRRAEAKRYETTIRRGRDAGGWRARGRSIWESFVYE